MNRTKKKVHQKIELTFNFTREIPVKKVSSILQKKSLSNLFGIKKVNPEVRPKNRLIIVNF